MLSPFFALAMRAPGRQLAFRRAAVAHLLVVGALAAAVATAGVKPGLFGQLLVVAGIVEGAALVGWRLTQLPKSQALEFLLVSPLRPDRLFAAEAAVGVARLALVGLSGLPVLALLAFTRHIDPLDVPILLVLPFTYGALTGLGLTAWAYEPLSVRRWGELVGLAGVLVYLVVGVLAAGQLGNWLRSLPPAVGKFLFDAVLAMHHYNPFTAVEYWLDPAAVPAWAWERLSFVQWTGLAAAGVLAVRATFRLKGHFHDRHYRPVSDERAAETETIGERPLSWWAVRRVMEYSGRVNLYLAGGMSVIYSAYIVAGQHWPRVLGTEVFKLLEEAGGVASMTTGLVVLAAVPAAFQYGLWDPTVQDRCRRLELLLLTGLSGGDYWHAAAAAAWKRGYGYFAIAGVLWAAAWWAGRMTAGQVLGAAAAGVVLWAFSFAVGFRAFASGAQANGLGSLLTIGLPFLVAAFWKAGLPALAYFLPPGAVYGAQAGTPGLAWAAGVVLAGAWAVWLARAALARCEAELRAWYDRNQGRIS